MTENKIEKYELKNGLTVLIENIGQFRSVSIGLFLNRGSRDENEDEAGFFHFCEHMIFKGTSTRSKKDLAETFDEMGGYLNAYTNYETVCIYNRVPAYHQMKSLEVMMEMFNDSVFDVNEADLERQVILSEINSIFEDPQDKVQEDFMSSVFPAQGLGNPVIGTIGSVTEVMRDALYGFYENNFCGDDLVVSLSGKVDRDAVINYLERLDVRRRTPVRGKRSVQGDKKFFFTKMPSEQLHLVMGTSKFDLDEKSYFQSGVFNLILGESMSSILFQKIREEYGLCYSIYSTVSSFREESLFEIYTSVMPENSARIIDSLNSVISDLKKNGISESELMKAKKQKIAEIYLNSDLVNKRMSRMAMMEMKFSKIYDENMIAGLIEKTTSEDLNSLIGSIFKKENFVIQGLYKNNIKLKMPDF
jgi:predicted Zn-dependent peptidase